jgi:hypothetical protein
MEETAGYQYFIEVNQVSKEVEDKRYTQPCLFTFASKTSGYILLWDAT